MNTLLILWLITGQPVEIQTSLEACELAVASIDNKVPIIVELMNGETTFAVSAQCVCREEEGGL